MALMELLDGKDILVGAIDVANDAVETPEQVADVIGQAMQFVPKERIVAGTNCGMAPMRRDIAEAKLVALGKGAALARQRYA
jgi:5-methyltetrahydropteroyltriglutamate--homocysteine methyltransferase